MGRLLKIDVDLLDEMLREGKTQAECAAFFGVTQPAIFKQKKKLGIAVKKNVAKSVVTERAPMVVAQRLNAIEQLDYLWSCTDEILVACMNWLRGDDDEATALRILESQVKYVMVGENKDKKAVKEFKFKDPRELALKAIGQAVGVNREKRELLKTLYDVEAVKEFQEELIDLLGEVDQVVRDEFIRRLREKGVVRSILEFNDDNVKHK